METLYFYCAVTGGAILVLQVLLLLLGAGDHDTSFDGHDVDDPSAAGDAFFKVLSFKTVVAFLTFFGLSGLASLQAGLGRVPTLMISFAAGSVALYLVAWMMAGLARLQSSGNVDLQNAVGLAAKVYLTVPGGHAGRGKVTVLVQGRTVEAKAVTAGQPLATGSMVRVVGAPAPDTLEVAPLSEE